MSQEPFYLQVWGCRGSIATPGPSTVKYGGNTSCLEVRCGSEIIIFDAGTGLKNLGRSLVKEFPEQQMSAHLLLSHIHWDHIQGFPFFIPILYGGNHLTIYGERKGRDTFYDYFSRQMQAPYFPIKFKQLPLKPTFKEVKPRQNFLLAPDIQIKTARAYHPNGCLSYRLEYRDKIISYVTDAEMKTADIDPNLIQIAQDADYLLCDGMYTPEQYTQHVGWGHMSWKQSVELAKLANVKNLLLWHHHHIHDDETMANIEKEAQTLFPNTLVAYEGMRIAL